jgi:plasmid stabilization system protein ParE
LNVGCFRSQPKAACALTPHPPQSKTWRQCGRSWRVNGFEKWLVFYLTGEKEVEIIRVRHGMMNLPEIFEMGQ